MVNPDPTAYWQGSGLPLAGSKLVERGATAPAGLEARLETLQCFFLIGLSNKAEYPP